MNLRHSIFNQSSLLWMLGALAIFFSSCLYESKEKFDVCNTENINYKDSVVAILDNYGCISCHSDQFASGGVDLEGYDDVKTYVDSDLLIKSMKHADGVSPMPKSAPKMQACDIDKIEAWIYDGALNN